MCRGSWAGEAIRRIADVSDLAVRFARLAGEYDFRKRAATALVERWDWYSWPGLDLRPLYFERGLLKPGRRLGVRPPVDRDVLRIGFDAEGRAVVTEEYSGFRNADGCVLPFRTVIHDGLGDSEIDVASVRFDVAVPARAFTARAPALDAPRKAP